MATADNRSAEVVGIQGLIQSMLSRQEQQFQKLFRENQLQNHFISTQLGELNEKLTSLGADSKSLSIRTLSTAPSPLAHPELSPPELYLPEASLGVVQGDNTGATPTQSPGGDSTRPGEEARRDGFIHSPEVSLDVANPEHVTGKSLLQDMEEQMRILELEEGLTKNMSYEEIHMDDNSKIEQGLVQDVREKLIDDNPELGQNLMKDLEEKRMLDNQEKDLNLLQQMETQMELIGMDKDNPMESIAENDTITIPKRKIRILEANAETAEFRSKQLEERNQQLQASLRAQELEAQQCREQVETVRGHTIRARAETTKFQARTDELEQRVKQRDEKLASLHEQKDQLQRVLDTAESKSDGQADKNKELMVDWLRDKDYYKKKVEQQESKINELRLKADKAEISQNKCATLEAERQRWFEWSNKATADLENESAKNSRLQQQLSETTGRIKDYDRVIREKGDKIDQRKRQVDDLEESIKVQQLSYGWLDSDLEVEKNASKSLREAKDKIESELTKTREELTNLQKQVESKKNEEQAGFPQYFTGAQAGPASMYTYNPYFPSSSSNEK